MEATHDIKRPSRMSLALGLAILGLPLAALMALPVRQARAAFPGRNGKIVYERQLGFGPIHIFATNPEGSHRRRLTHNGDCGSPAVSPNGRRIAFGRFRGIWVMRADGSHQRRVDRLGGRPNYSPHGKRITFDRHFRGIWVMRADGSHTHRLTQRDGDSDPAFSPNGKRIVFYRGNPQQIWVMRADGSHQHPVTHGRADSGEPDWGVRH